MKLNFKETEFLTKETYGFTDHMPQGTSDGGLTLGEDGTGRRLVSRGDGYFLTENGETRRISWVDYMNLTGQEIRENGRLINNPLPPGHPDRF